MRRPASRRGALGACWSGAGSTMLAVTMADDADAVRVAGEALLAEHERERPVAAPRARSGRPRRRLTKFARRAKRAVARTRSDRQPAPGSSLRGHVRHAGVHLRVPDDGPARLRDRHHQLRARARRSSSSRASSSTCGRSATKARSTKTSPTSILNDLVAALDPVVDDRHDRLAGARRHPHHRESEPSPMSEQPSRSSVEGLAFPEGPVAMPDGSVILVEIKTGKLTRVAPDGTKSMVADVGGGPERSRRRPRRRAVCLQQRRLHLDRNRRDEHPASARAACRSRRSTRAVRSNASTSTPVKSPRSTPSAAATGSTVPNDIVVRRGRRTVVHRPRQDPRARHRPRLHLLGQARRLRDPASRGGRPRLQRHRPVARRHASCTAVTTSNGHLYSWDVAGPGELAGGNPLTGGGIFVGARPARRPVRLTRHRRRTATCASPRCCNEPGITVFSPNGEIVERVRCPDPMPTNICFGGDDMRTAWVTLSAMGKLAKTHLGPPRPETELLEPPVPLRGVQRSPIGSRRSAVRRTRSTRPSSSASSRLTATRPPPARRTPTSWSSTRVRSSTRRARNRSTP